ncbi:carbamoyl-phosphate synthase, large subunit [Plesiocystis pacifica SIR-1]|uniref:Carbamoyl phosphate synthase large chain n=1 Tax=Plesiocystis pacifica SIR-1 TaxID=391625 RepID=A6G979_9BACT|nr:carbamoyl-phosphate synthase large subunit [Plesiocystis pacifica]EDM77627.1 carbamoyl-phosphate synthase, large subunit [Plesiocystis pacifica SIR-1]
MPRRDDIKRICVLGSGPIVIGQACEFDYSGTQAIKALRQEGYEVVLINSNPATIMTDPELADETYVRPLTPDDLDQVLRESKPDAVLPTVGGQTALNLALEAGRRGIFEHHGVELLGAPLEVIEKAEDRDRFKALMVSIGLEVPRSFYVHDMAEARDALDEIGFPAIIRPSFTMGGAGAAIAYNREEFEKMAAHALSESLRSEALIEESVLGWKEYELEVMRDGKDNFVVICAIENLDPMGVHTGDSVTLAPALTLTDKEYQHMRTAAAAVVNAVGVTTGGCNIQFAFDPESGRMIVIEMNPRVSRSSALASKATGFPIAKFAAKLAVGYTLDELDNDITKVTPASFEPSIDYIVTKIPRFAFEKFKGADDTLTIQMKSVGEAMAIGRTVRESLGKAMRSMETETWGFDIDVGEADLDRLEALISRPSPQRLWLIGEALRQGMSIERVHQRTKIDPWFLHHIAAIVELEERIAKGPRGKVPAPAALLEAKRGGLSDPRIAALCGSSEDAVRERRLQAGVRPVYKTIDTCAAEFEAHTPYLYSTYEEEDESNISDRKKVVILGGGPNRIGQGIEFDYCCCHAAFALRDAGFETIMVNCNPETVSTDYDTSDRLYFEPLTRENVLDILDLEARSGEIVGVLVQFGGQTPLKLASAIERAGYSLLGTPADSIDRAEDRGRFGELVTRLGLHAPRWGVARSPEEAFNIAHQIGFPVLVRPSYVLGGRAMEIVHSDEQLDSYMKLAVRASPDHPVLIDEFLAHAVEFDVDAVADGKDVVIAGIMEHVEEAGIHSGDSTCCMPPVSVGHETLKVIRETTESLARELGVVGLMNVQYALKGERLYILEVNPRGSRTVPFVSKAVGTAFAKIAALVGAGKSLAELGVEERVPEHVSVKVPVFPFVKFPGVDVLLSPEMRSTGEVMGIAKDFGAAFNAGMAGAGVHLPQGGRVFISVANSDKQAVIPVAKHLRRLGFEIIATRGTARKLEAAGIACAQVNKVAEGRPHIVDRIVNGDLTLVVNTTDGEQAARDSLSIRRSALAMRVPYFTTLAGAQAAAHAIEASRSQGRVLPAVSLQDYHQRPSFAAGEEPDARERFRG